MNTTTTRSLLTVIFLLSASLPLEAKSQRTEGYAALKEQAERFYAEDSYALAHQVYAQAQTAGVPESEKRWVAFRLADTLWRSQVATNNPDTTIEEQARTELESIIAAVKREEDRDHIWVEAHESLGDYFWTRPRSQNWGRAWPHYQLALDHWAGSGDLDQARDRYLAIVWDMSMPPWQNVQYYYGSSYVPRDILENALKISVSKPDRARASFLLAMTYRSYGDRRQQQRVADLFEIVLKQGKATQWYDDALFSFAQWLSNNGRVTMLANGQWSREYDYVGAVKLYRRILREFRRGETRYYDNARQQIKSITGPSLSVGVSNIFLPGSEIQYYLNWRNLKRIDLALYQVDLTRDVRLDNSHNRDNSNWLNMIDLTVAEQVDSWVHQTTDQGDHKPGQSVEQYEVRLTPGAYIIEATGGKSRARELILVSDASIVIKTSGDQILAYVCDAMDGSPLSEALVHVSRSAYRKSRWITSTAQAFTDADGMCVFDAESFDGIASNHRYSYFIAAKIGRRQAFALTTMYANPRTQREWRSYVFTDRPAYRPGETVQWKALVRLRTPKGYTTPVGQAVKYTISDPRGSEVESGTLTLNAFGSIWGEIELDDTQPLGEYRIVLHTDNPRAESLGNQTLFRLEEYKLPEFKVAISTPEENGTKKAFRLGETVEINIQANYYFGGPVANANVEVIVYQTPFYQWWSPPREFPWCYQTTNPYQYWGSGQVIKQETIRTDETGAATLSFDTPPGSQQDMQYRIEARVTDSSRREIVASDTVRVTRQRYYVYPVARHNIHRPHERIEIDFKALDANSNPVETCGTVTVSRDEWVEIWLDPYDKEVTGDLLTKLKQSGTFPPPLPPDQPLAKPWRLKHRGYTTEEIIKRSVCTDAQGEAVFVFTAPRDGYYRINWRSEDKDSPGSMPITAQTMVWVCSVNTTQLGYRSGELDIIVDKDTFRAGQNAPVMISTLGNNKFVLFTVEGMDLYSYQLVRMSGNVKLISVPIDQRHVPNVYLGAMMVSDGLIHRDMEQIVVPPVDHFLEVTIESDREQYQPGEEGTFTITAKDHEGNPVAAEIAMGLIDASVLYIQQDYAGDPRQFFFSDRQVNAVGMTSTFNQKPYAKLAENENEQLIDVKNEKLASMNRLDLNGIKKSNGPADMVSTTFAFGGRGGGQFGAMAQAAPASKSRSFRGVMVQSAMEVSDDQGFGMRSEEEKDMQPGQPIKVRTDFRSTLLWLPDIHTDENGKATIPAKYADSLTSWKATARVATTTSQFGIASVTIRTRKPLIARLQAPRFFVVGDQVTISGIFNNNTNEAMTVQPALDILGLTITGMMKDGRMVKAELGPIVIPPHGEMRLDWVAIVETPGEAKITLSARSDEYTDGMVKSYPVHEHGIEKFIAKSGKVRGDDVTVTIQLPGARKDGSTSLSVQITPSMAVTMLDALPYLIDYPYGCTEQTMSRFLPAAIVAKTLRDRGIDPAEAMNKVFGGIERDHLDKTHPKGKRDLTKLDDMTNKSLARLYDFQHADGGWGWWKQGDSDRFMTSYVLWGLTLAKQADIDVAGDVMSRAANYLNHEIVKDETSYDRQAWTLHALSAYHRLIERDAPTAYQRVAIENLWKNRSRLNAYTRALFALSAHQYGLVEKAQTLVRNLENGVIRDRTPDTSIVVRGKQKRNRAVIGTAHWGQDGMYWRWSDGGVEATAFALRAMLAIDPDNKLIEPVTNWLIKNRRGSQWSNTRDTAIVVLALNDYLAVSGELDGGIEYELTVNGRLIATRHLTAEEVLAAPSRFEIDPSLIRDGDNTIHIVRKRGTGPIYFSAEATYFSHEEPIPAAGNEIFVRRDYYRLTPRPTLLKGYVYDRILLTDGDYVRSGERIEVVLSVETKNNYEYLIFEDLKPAGFEAVQLKSGEAMYARQLKASAAQRLFGKDRQMPANGAPAQAGLEWKDYTGRRSRLHQELRDRKVAMFIDRLPEGVWQMTYELRAETPGKFHALPVLGHAMYVPEIRCNSGEIRVNVLDRDDYPQETSKALTRVRNR